MQKLNNAENMLRCIRLVLDFKYWFFWQIFLGLPSRLPPVFSENESEPELAQVQLWHCRHFSFWSTVKWALFNTKVFVLVSLRFLYLYLMIGRKKVALRNFGSQFRFFQSFLKTFARPKHRISTWLVLKIFKLRKTRFFVSLYS